MWVALCLKMLFQNKSSNWTGRVGRKKKEERKKKEKEKEKNQKKEEDERNEG